MNQIDRIVERILRIREHLPVERSLLAGISGIDASGKGFVAAKVNDELRRRSIKSELINVDGWLNLSETRFGGDDPGKHFYDHALRLDQMFEQLVLPLKRNRSIRLTADLTKETAEKFHQFEYRFDDVHVILLEGIFLFKKQYVRHFDLKIWIDCSITTALQRAIERSQEGLGSEQTTEAYERVYFPAQQQHFETDHPRLSADLLFDND